MSLKEELLQILNSLAPKVVDRKRALLEHEQAAIDISDLLREPFGLEVIEYLTSELDHGKKQFYLTDHFVEKHILVKIINYHHNLGESKDLSILLCLYHQVLKIVNDDSNLRDYHKTQQQLKISKAAGAVSPALSICFDCHNSIDPKSVNCSHCGSKNKMNVNELSLAKPAIAVLKNNQYLELHVKKSLGESGIKLIGYEPNAKSKMVFTSIRYQVEGEEIDIDVHGTSQPLALWLCEVKTSEKVDTNEMRRIENIYSRFIKNINSRGGKKFHHQFLYITTGKFDRNISFDAYKRKGWAFLDRDKIQNLKDELENIRKTL